MNTLAYIVWDPPLGITLGSFTLRYYSLMFVIAFTLGFYIMKKIYLREKQPLEQLDTLLIYVVVATLLGARLGHVFFYDWAYFKHHPAEILLPFQFDPEFKFTGFQGLASHGAAIGIILAMYYFSKKVSKKPMLWILDRIVIPVAIGGSFVRIGNLMNSEIVGKQAPEVPWAFQFVQLPQYMEPLIPRHPSQLYEAFCYAVVFAVLWYFYKKGKGANLGFLFGVFMVLLWTVRFFVEFFKANQKAFEEGMSLNMGQWLSIPLILAGAYFVRASKNKIYKA